MGGVGTPVGHCRITVGRASAAEELAEIRAAIAGVRDEVRRVDDAEAGRLILRVAASQERLAALVGRLLPDQAEKASTSQPREQDSAALAASAR